MEVMLSDKEVVSRMVLGIGLVGIVGACAVGIGAGLALNPVGKGIGDKRDTLGSVGLVSEAIRSVIGKGTKTVGFGH